MTPLLQPGEASRLRPGEPLVIVRPGDFTDESCICSVTALCPHRIAPQAWVALTGPCPTCEGTGKMPGRADADGSTIGVCPNPDCRDGHRIVPLYTECEHEYARLIVGSEVDEDQDWICDACGADDGNPDGQVLVGRGWIEVVPVVTVDQDTPCLVVRGEWVYFITDEGEVDGPRRFDPLPVPGQDFGIVTHCTEVVS